MLQLFIYVGALVVIGVSFLMGLESARAQLTMVTVLGAILGFALLLVILLDYPFSGDVSVPNVYFTKGELSQVTPRSRGECDQLFAKVTSGGLYTPPGLTPTLLFPGTMGGATWSGGAVDPGSSMLVVPTNEVGAIAQMVPAMQTPQFWSFRICIPA